jgi:hypothetical protein
MSETLVLIAIFLNLAATAWSAYGGYQYRKKRREPAPCFHQFKKTAVQHEPPNPYGNSLPTTIASCLCLKCGYVASGTWTGIWSVEELNGNSGADELQRMYDK